DRLMSMRIASVRRYGDPSGISLISVPIPPVQSGQIRVQVMYSSVNRTDTAFLRGRPLLVRLAYGIRRPRFRALGSEFAGIVETVGEQVTGFSPGDRVFGFDDAPTGFGGHAEYKVI